MSKRAALGISLTAILCYWLYPLVTQRWNPPLPASFPELVMRIVRIKLLVLGSVYLLLRLGGERFGDLGLTSRGWPRALGSGLLAGLAMFVGLNVVLESVLGSLLPRPPAAGTSIASFFRQPGNLLVWLPIGVFGGGVVEELQRIFIITRFEKWLGRTGLVLGVTLSSAMFGLGHLYKGPGTALSTAVSGVVFSLLYLRRRSALVPITAHAFSDVLAMLGMAMLAS